MNLPAADSIGPASMLDVLAPTAAALGDAPAEVSFNRLLNERNSEPPGCPRPACHQRQEQSTEASENEAVRKMPSSETPCETTSACEPASAAEKPAPSEEPSDHEDDASDAVIIVPTVVLNVSPAVDGEAAQIELEPTTEPAEGRPALPTRDGASAATAGREAAAILAATPSGKHAAAKRADADLTRKIELDKQLESDPSASRPFVDPKRRMSDDNGAEPGRVTKYSLQNQPGIQAEAAVAVEAVAAGNLEPKGSETPVSAASTVEAVQPSATPSPTNPHQQPPAPRLLPESLAAASGRMTRDADAPLFDSVRLLNRVARAFALAQDGSGEVRLRLSPPELGALRLEAKVLDGVLVARLETETSAARTALIQNLPALRDRLAEQGIRIERFDVDLMQHHHGGAFERPANQQPPDLPPPPPVAERPRRLPQVADGVVARAIVTDLDQRHLNVIV